MLEYFIGVIGALNNMKLVSIDIPFVYDDTTYRETFLFTRTPTRAELLSVIEQDFSLALPGPNKAMQDVVKQIQDADWPTINNLHRGCNRPVILSKPVENPHVVFGLVPVYNPDLD